MKYLLTALCIFLSIVLKAQDTIYTSVNVDTFSCEENLTYCIETSLSVQDYIWSDGDTSNICKTLQIDTNPDSLIFNFTYSVDTMIAVIDTIAMDTMYIDTSLILFDSILFQTEFRDMPVGLFTSSTTCDNENIIINNESIMSDSAMVSIIYANVVINSFENVDSFNLGMFNGGVNHFFIFETDNKNGCFDYDTLIVEVLQTPDVDFIGLQENYCFNQESTLLMPDSIGGQFFNSVNIIGEEYIPTNIVENDLVCYKYTAYNGCIDTTCKIVSNVFPLPELIFSGFENEFCENDPPVEISSQSGAVFSIIQNIDQQDEVTWVYSPDVAGDFQCNYYYTDFNGCADSTTFTITVNPVPDLGDIQDTILMQFGSILTIGDTIPNSNWDYLWNTGSTNNTIDVMFPGDYEITVIDKVTKCTTLDTIFVRLVTRSEDVDEKKPNIFPNPAYDFIRVDNCNVDIIDIYSTIDGEIHSLRFTKTGPNHIYLDISSLTPGLYFVLFEKIKLSFIKLE